MCMCKGCIQKIEAGGGGKVSVNQYDELFDK